MTMPQTRITPIDRSLCISNREIENEMKTTATTPNGLGRSPSTISAQRKRTRA
jgi:hypothetical protein